MPNKKQENHEEEIHEERDPARANRFCWTSEDFEPMKPFDPETAAHNLAIAPKRDDQGEDAETFPHGDEMQLSAEDELILDEMWEERVAANMARGQDAKRAAEAEQEDESRQDRFTWKDGDVESL